MNFREQLATESSTYLVHETKFVTVVIHSQQQRAKIGARSLRVGVSADDERTCEWALDLEPIRAAHSPIRGLAPFCNYALQTGFRHLVIEFAAVTNHVVAIAQRTVTANELTQQMFALLKR